MTETTTVTGTATSTETASPNEVAQLPSQTVTPIATPTGWQTSWAQQLGIKLVAEYNSDGPAAWNATQHPTVYITSNSMGYSGFFSGLTTPGIAIMDANTHQVILTKQFSIANQTTYNEPHGLGVSMDGRYIYLPTGSPSAPVNERGQLLVIDARTLLIHQIIEAPSMSGYHHVTAFRLYNGTDVVFAIPFGTKLLSSFRGTGPLNNLPGSPYFLMDPAKDNKVIGGFSENQIPSEPYLAFPDPDGQHMFVGGSSVYVIDMKTWSFVKSYPGTSGAVEWANMFAFTNDGRYVYWSSSETSQVVKVDNVQQSIVATAASPAAGPYGVTLNYNETSLYTVGKGEGTGNQGNDLGFVNAVTMTPVRDYVTGGIRGDHALTDPVHTDEIWISMNANFRTVAWNTTSNTIDATMLQSGSSHNGAFATYKVLANGQWQGSLLSDQNGLHGAALIAQDKALGVTQVYYGGQTYKTEDQRVLPGESP